MARISDNLVKIIAHCVEWQFDNELLDPDDVGDFTLKQFEDWLEERDLSGQIGVILFSLKMDQSEFVSAKAELIRLRNEYGCGALLEDFVTFHYGE